MALVLGLPGCHAAERAPAAPSSASPDAVKAEEAALFTRGREAAARGDSVRAEQYLALAIQRGYDEQRVLPVLLRACISSLHLRGALDHAEAYLVRHPEDGALRYLTATIYLGLGQKDEARAQLERLVHAAPETPSAQFLLGILDLQTDASAAREHLRQYLALAPLGEHGAEARSRLADLDVDLGAKRPRRVRR